MNAKIRRLHTPDAPSLREFLPDEEDDFSLLVQILAGPDGEAGEESFDLEVVTPKCLARRVSRGRVLSGRHLLIVERFDAEGISRWIERAVASCSGGDWTEVATKLGRLARWEFEDYSV